MVRLVKKINLTASQSDYLSAIYNISKKGDVRVTTIAEYLNYSKPSVVNALKTLDNLKLINYNEGIIKLTEIGEKHAKDIIRRDKILQKFMIDVLGVEENIAKIDSTKIKHAVSCYTITKLEEYICEILKIETNIDDDCVYDCNSKICESCGRFFNQ